MTARDAAIRLAAFQFLEEQVALRGEVLPRSVLQQGFSFENQRVPLVGPQGIFKPAAMTDMPLSITTAPIVEGRDRPYEDQIDESGLIRYRYRGQDPNHRENAGLRAAMESQTPLIYFYGVLRGNYMAVWPVFIVGDDPRHLTFTVAVDEQHSLSIQEAHNEVVDIRRAYVTRLTRQRLHQAGFRQRVIAAYQTLCAICRLRHEELLDAAHILPDGHPRGSPIVPNGLALCKLHHSAFDQNVLGIRPDLTVEISHSVLEEIDGPMLIHGLQGFHGSKLIVPRNQKLRPNTEFLAERYELFRTVG
ncbi:MAG TPA: HNH endonuclease [Actinomycetota bacterium]|nr:HNH endonuclease [Actinomycetota bacterium]